MASEKKKVLVLGSTGMLGSKVFEMMERKYGVGNVIGTIRKTEKARMDRENIFFDPITCRMVTTLGSYDFEYVINCIGLIKPVVAEILPEFVLRINSVFPHQLAGYCNAAGSRLIHITTDCVFSGSRKKSQGGYSEGDPHDATDLYGRSKSLGEPENCLTIRTSIIGEEPYNQRSLVEWAKSQKGQDVFGFTNHWWNGVTTTQYAKICLEIIEKDLYLKGVRHVFSPREITKFGLLGYLDNKFDLGLKVSPIQDAVPTNRILKTEKDLNSLLTIPPIDEQIEEM